MLLEITFKIDVYPSVSQWQLGIKNGVFIGVPIPEEFEAAGIEIQLQVEQAIRESEENGVSKSGKEATPWILKRVAELTQGKSLPSSASICLYLHDH